MGNGVDDDEDFNIGIHNADIYHQYLWWMFIFVGLFVV